VYIVLQNFNKYIIIEKKKQEENMYFLTFIHKNVEQVGFLNEEKKGVIPAGAVFEKLGIKAPSDMISLIEAVGEIDIEYIRSAADSISERTISTGEVKILSPIPYPKRNVLCLGKNYLAHISEVKSLKNVLSDVPAKPIYFSKIAYPAVGDKECVDSHSDVVKELDYEAELAVIIGKKCKNVKKEDAYGCIFGYSVANDISARDVQTSHVQWHMGKSFDTFCPIGPYIVHKSKIQFPPALEIKSYVNGELRQKGNTSELIFDIQTIISDLTQGITLYPGDIILTGTPAGVGAGFNPPKYLKPGDKVECLIENIGMLTNNII
jgi:2-keto-4-pentenoate hydratase/2-oxohepta-3-ene-1,7-dioic acid hydratase in catechol pathway